MTSKYRLLIASLLLTSVTLSGLVSRRSNSLSILRGVCFVVGDGEGRGVGDVGSGQGGAATMASIEHDA